MGWIHEDAPEHEGYLVALVREEARSADGLAVMRSRWRELSGLVHDEAAQRRFDGSPVPAVQVACECGWRSMRVAAPRGTMWRPHCVVVLPSEEEAFEALALELWTAHVREHGDVEFFDELAGRVARATRLRAVPGGGAEFLSRYVLAPRRERSR